MGYALDKRVIISWVGEKIHLNKEIHLESVCEESQRDEELTNPQLPFQVAVGGSQYLHKEPGIHPQSG